MRVRTVRIPDRLIVPKTKWNLVSTCGFTTISSQLVRVVSRWTAQKNLNATWAIHISTRCRLHRNVIRRANGWTEFGRISLYLFESNSLQRIRFAYMWTVECSNRHSVRLQCPHETNNKNHSINAWLLFNYETEVNTVSGHLGGPTTGIVIELFVHNCTQSTWRRLGIRCRWAEWRNFSAARLNDVVNRCNGFRRGQGRYSFQSDCD